MSEPRDLLTDPALLAEARGWSTEVYRHLLRLQSGDLTEAEFRRMYACRRAVLVMDMTSYTSSAIHDGEIVSLLRILDAQKVCLPTLDLHGAILVRCFADDIIALFDEPRAALDAVLDIHSRIHAFNDSSLAGAHPTRICAGIGFGDLFAIGPNLAQGDEMNRASKLGEDIARAGETLLTESARHEIGDREGLRFERQDHDDQLFPFYAVARRAVTG